MKKVLGRCRGGFLLSTPPAALEIVARVRDALPPHIPLTVKMRRGLDDTQQSRDNFFTIFDGAFGLGVAAITVHGRTVKQRYDGPSKWEFLRDVKRHAPDRIVLGSGDAFTAEDCLRMLVETGVNGVTAARGAIGNPWIFRQARAGRWSAVGASLAGRAAGGDAGALSAGGTDLRLQSHLRPHAEVRHLGTRMHPQHKAVREAFVGVKTRDQWHAVVEEWYQEGSRHAPRACYFIANSPSCRSTVSGGDHCPASLHDSQSRSGFLHAQTRTWIPY